MKKAEQGKLIFGSAGFGLENYGFSSLNKRSHISTYLKNIYNLGFRHIDTAPSYGFSDRIIGNYHKVNNRKFCVWTKVDSLDPNSHFTVDKIYDSAKKSLANNNVECFECLYLHQNDIKIIEDKFVLKGLQNLKSCGITKNVGTSIYNALELEGSISIDTYDVVQIPVNALNTYLYKIAQKHASNKKIVGRSVFLQGTLLNIEHEKKKINYSYIISEKVKLLKELAHSHNLSYIGMLTSYVKSLESLNHIIVSSNNINNLETIVRNSNLKLPDDIINTINKMSQNENDWANPRNWVV